jgi:hypothetical protein
MTTLTVTSRLYSITIVGEIASAPLLFLTLRVWPSEEEEDKKCVVYWYSFSNSSNLYTAVDTPAGEVA